MAKPMTLDELRVIESGLVEQTDRIVSRNAHLDTAPLVPRNAKECETQYNACLRDELDYCVAQIELWQVRRTITELRIAEGWQCQKTCGGSKCAVKGGKR